MNKNIVIALIVILVLATGGFFLMNRSERSTAITPEATSDATIEGSESTAGDTSKESELPGEAMEENVKEFTVTGKNFSFDRQEIMVKKGDTVRITFVNEEGFHDWVVDEFNARTQQIQAGQSETIEFVADQAGTFEYYCSVGQHRQMGMVGTLTVEE